MSSLLSRRYPFVSPFLSQSNVHIPEFLRENRVYFGGDVKSVSSTLMAMHPFNEDIIPGAQKVSC